MISIIICSADPVKLRSVSENIQATIGIAHEIIAINNADRKYGICKAYNEGVKKSRYPFLCFMHEDISYDTEQWGEIVCRHLSKPETGLIGVAGGDAKSCIPSSWSIPVFSNEINLVQHYKQSPDRVDMIRQTRANTLSGENKVAVLDGLWFCARRSLFRLFAFDEINFPGFHGYDIDFSLQVGELYDLLVVSDIRIHHFSEGNPDRDWMQAAITISKKWNTQLPRSPYYTDKQLLKEHHWKVMQVFLQHLSRLQYRRGTAFLYFLKYSLGRFFSARKFGSMCKYFFSLHYK